MLKAVVDVGNQSIALDAELHADLESLLLDNGSKQRDLWGINLYLDQAGDEFIEFDSMINLRPGQNNMSRGVDDGETRRKIVNIVNQWVKR